MSNKILKIAVAFSLEQPKLAPGRARLRAFELPLPYASL